MLHTYPVFVTNTETITKNESNAYWKESAIGFINKGTTPVTIGLLKLMPGESVEYGMDGTGCVTVKESIVFATVSSETATVQNGLESLTHFEEAEILLKKCHT
jgi:hypothetical protein